MSYRDRATRASTRVTPLLVTLTLATLAASACRDEDDEAHGTPEFLSASTVMPSTLPFSEAVRVGNVMYLSGQIGIRPGTMTLVDGGMPAEARQTMDNVKAVLAAHGRTMADVVKCTVMLADMSEWAAFNEIYKSYFTAPYPARSALGANGLALGARVEVECIASAGARGDND